MNKLLPLVLLVLACSQEPPQVTSKNVAPKIETVLQAIAIVDENVVWISGHASTFIRTTDGGDQWEVFSHPKIDSLQFRDIHAFSKDQVALMSAGPGAMSRIFVFAISEGWEETYVMEHEEGFLNTIEFWDDQNGLAFGDSFDGELFVLRTEDGGSSWSRIDPSALPAANPGEGGFAASGTCIATRSGGLAWIGTGAGGTSRILKTSDYGVNWEEVSSPLVKGELAGITSIRMATNEVGTLVGGDLAVTDAYTANTAFTDNSGKSWQLTGFPNTKGALYGSDIIHFDHHFFWIACGPNGMDYTWNMGKSWTTLDTANYWAVDMHLDGFGYAAGKDGEVVRIELGD